MNQRIICQTVVIMSLGSDDDSDRGLRHPERRNICITTPSTIGLLSHTPLPLRRTVTMPPISLNLKQKLASLSQSTTSSSPFGNESPSSPATMKKKFNFNPPWVKRQQNPTGPGDYREEGTLQEVMSRMIFQAGVDFEWDSFFFSQPRFQLITFIIEELVQCMLFQTST